jgi:hypothetical protein
MLLGSSITMPCQLTPNPLTYIFKQQHAHDFHFDPVAVLIHSKKQTHRLTTLLSKALSIFFATQPKPQVNPMQWQQQSPEYLSNHPSASAVTRAPQQSPKCLNNTEARHMLRIDNVGCSLQQVQGSNTVAVNFSGPT